MEDKITYIMRCGYCDKTDEFIARNKNINNTITDDDIRRMMSLESPTRIEYCSHCKLETLQTKVAWRGTLDIER